MWTDQIPEGAEIIDLRDPESFEEYHYPGSRNIPFDELVRLVSEEKLPKDRKYLLVCYAGMKTGMALNVMRGHGYDAVGMIGGIGTLKRIQDEQS